VPREDPGEGRAAALRLATRRLLSLGRDALALAHEVAQHRAHQVAVLLEDPAEHPRRLRGHERALGAGEAGQLRHLELGHLRPRAREPAMADSGTRAVRTASLRSPKAVGMRQRAS
jgi:hypothetical protein